MISYLLRTSLVALALVATMPAIAQTPPAGQPMPYKRQMQGRAGGPVGMGMMDMRPAFATLSEPGQAILRDAMRGAGDRRVEHAAVRSARDRMLTILDADRLDTGALKKAMDDERSAAIAGRERTQAAMLAGFQKLSTADRKAFVNESRVLRARMESRLKQMGNRRGPEGFGAMGGAMGSEMPPPPPPPGF